MHHASYILYTVSHIICRLAFLIDPRSHSMCQVDPALGWLPGEEETKQAHQPHRSSCIEACAQRSTVAGALSPGSSSAFRLACARPWRHRQCIGRPVQCIISLWIPRHVSQSLFDISDTIRIAPYIMFSWIIPFIFHMMTKPMHPQLTGPRARAL